MSTQCTRVPAAAAAASKRSTRAAETPCGAAENKADTGARRTGAAVRRPHSRCRRARWPVSVRSFADHLRLAHIAQPQTGDDVIAEIRRIADGIEGLDIHLLADDFDAYLIVGG